MAPKTFGATPSIAMGSLRFFNPYEEIRFTENLLPHWQQKGATYFITFRLADSVPIHLRTQWEEECQVWLRFHPEPWDAETEQEYHKRFTAAIERWLDAGHGSCILRQSDCLGLSMKPCAISMANVSRLSHLSSCRITFTRSWFNIQNILWKICFTVGKRSLREPSIDYSGIPGLCGSEAILIDLCGMKNISATVFVIFGEIRRKHI